MNPFIYAISVFDTFYAQRMHDMSDKISCLTDSAKGQKIGVNYCQVTQNDSISQDDIILGQTPQPLPLTPQPITGKSNCTS